MVDDGEVLVEAVDEGSFGGALDFGAAVRASGGHGVFLARAISSPSVIVS